MKNKTVTPSQLRDSFLSWRKARNFGALAMVSLSTLKAVQTIEDRDANRQINKVMSERTRAMDDSIVNEEELGARIASIAKISAVEEIDTNPQMSYLLTTAERAQLASEYVSIKANKPVISESEENQEVFAPVAIEDYIPLVTPEIEAYSRFVLDVEDRLGTLLLTA